MAINICIAFLVYFFSLQRVSAHPLDQVYWTMIIQSETEVSMDMYISWQELSYIVETYGTPKQADYLRNTSSSGDAFTAHLTRLVSLSSVFEPYISQHLIVKNNGTDCSILFNSLPVPDKIEALVGKGIQIGGTIHCDKVVEKLYIQSTILQQEFPYQTTTVTIVKKNNNEYKYSTILSQKQNSVEINVVDKPIVHVSPPVVQQELPSNIYVNTSWITSIFHTKTIPTTVWGLLAFVYVLGLLHTLEAGHSKTILSSVVVDTRVSVWTLFVYVFVFVGTHIADILVLGVVFILVGSVTHIYTVMPVIQKFAAGLLVITATYMLKHALHHADGHTHTHEHIHSHHHRHELLWLGILSGIAPCLLGWSLMFMVVGSYPYWMIVPVIGVFGLGIASALSLFVVLLYVTRKHVLEKYQTISRIAPFVSAGIIWIYAVVSFVKMIR
jgi:ABC-type nickel/cobalt efflux system permease component RcnA